MNRIKCCSSCSSYELCSLFWIYHVRPPYSYQHNCTYFTTYEPKYEPNGHQTFAKILVSYTAYYIISFTVILYILLYYITHYVILYHYIPYCIIMCHIILCYVKIDGWINFIVCHKATEMLLWHFLHLICYFDSWTIFYSLIQTNTECHYLITSYISLVYSVYRDVLNLLLLITPLSLYHVIFVSKCSFIFSIFHFIVVLVYVPLILYFCYFSVFISVRCCCNNWISPLGINKGSSDLRQ